MYSNLFISFVTRKKKKKEEEEREKRSFIECSCRGSVQRTRFSKYIKTQSRSEITRLDW